MKERIKNKLLEIEKTENIKILFAIESGSRAWGFASPDSDYDIRFIYVRPRDFYLKLEKTRDVIELPIDKVFDINGWDLQKALRLLSASNPTLFEWANSPIIYKTSDVFEELRKDMSSYFQEKAALYHYLNTAKRTYLGHLDKEVVKAKKYFYAIRPILACKWILKNNTPPPVLFSTLVESILEEEMKPVIKDLMELKTNLQEVARIQRIDKINEYIERNLEQLQKQIQELPNNKVNALETLDKMFLYALDK